MAMGSRRFTEGVPYQLSNVIKTLPCRNRFLGVDSANLCSVAESIPWNRFLDALKV
jgi:hypothetical protein